MHQQGSDEPHIIHMMFHRPAAAVPGILGQGRVVPAPAAIGIDHGEAFPGPLGGKAGHHLGVAGVAAAPMEHHHQRQQCLAWSPCVGQAQHIVALDAIIDEGLFWHQLAAPELWLGGCGAVPDGLGRNNPAPGRQAEPRRKKEHEHGKVGKEPLHSDTSHD